MGRNSGGVRVTNAARAAYNAKGTASFQKKFDAFKKTYDKVYGKPAGNAYTWAMNSEMGIGPGY